jgi:hypothetical protein
MKRSLSIDQRGVSNVIIIGAVLLVAAVIGAVSWRFTQKDSSSTNGQSSNAQLTPENVAEYSSACNDAINDADLCKFFVSWGDTQRFSLVSTGNSEGTVTTSTIKIDGEKTYMKAEGAITYEVITIGNDTYMKGADTWWKQSVAEASGGTVNPDDYKYEAPTSNELTVEKPLYERVGKEACGNLQCFKYKSLDVSDGVSYIWFDDNDYKIRKMRTETGSNYNEQVYSYDGVSIDVPSPVKDLEPGMVFLPGQPEPTRLPDMSDITQ